jgi:hypothetical protein
MGRKKKVKKYGKEEITNKGLQKGERKKKKAGRRGRKEEGKEKERRTDWKENGGIKTK